LVKEKGTPTLIRFSSAVKETSVSASESEDVSDREGEKSRKRHKRRRRSPSPGGDGEEDGKRHKRKHKRNHRQDKERSLPKPAAPEVSELSGERKETEEEYDARLEREENERLAAARQRELERLKRQTEQEASSTDGVRFKGIFFSSHSPQRHS
jgi:peptidyl-prolyl isomerase G (cyclophilin G)